MQQVRVDSRSDLPIGYNRVAMSVEAQFLTDLC